MNAIKALFAVVMTMLALAAPMVNAQDADVNSRGLFVDLMTDDTWSSEERTFASGHLAQCKGVYLADKKRPSHVHSRRQRPEA